MIIEIHGIIKAFLFLKVSVKKINVLPFSVHQVGVKSVSFLLKVSVKVS